MIVERKLARRYAEAVFSLAQEQGRLEKFEAELAGADRALAAAPELTALLAHPEFPRESKLRLIEQALAGQVSAEMVSLLRLLVSRGRQALFPVIREEFAALADEARNLLRGRVASAIPLAPEQKGRLREKLAAITGKQVELQEELDPALLAGVRVWLGDRMIDGSAAGRLAALRLSLIRPGGQ